MILRAANHAHCDAQTLVPVLSISRGKTWNKANPLPPWGITPWVNYTRKRCASVYHPCRYLSSRCYQPGVISTLADLARPRHELLFSPLSPPPFSLLLLLLPSAERVSTPPLLLSSIHGSWSTGLVRTGG